MFFLLILPSSQIYVVYCEVTFLIRFPLHLSVVQTFRNHCHSRLNFVNKLLIIILPLFLTNIFQAESKLFQITQTALAIHSTDDASLTLLYSIQN